jgi:hypothetical protein
LLCTLDLDRESQSLTRAAGVADTAARRLGLVEAAAERRQLAAGGPRRAISATAVSRCKKRAPPSAHRRAWLSG